MRRLIFLFTFLILVGIAGFVYWYYYNPFGDGTRVGMLQKFSGKGNVFKTYEGELLQEGFGRQGRGGTLSAQYFYFSVEEEAVAAEEFAAPVTSIPEKISSSSGWMIFERSTNFALAICTLCFNLFWIPFLTTD